MKQQNTPFLSIYFCDSQDCAPGHSYGPAVRPHYLLHIIRSGKGCFHHNNIVYHLQAGDAFLISPLESTFYQADETKPWRYSWIGFDGSAVKSLLSTTCFAQSCIFSCTLLPQRQTAYFACLNRLLSSWQQEGPTSYTPLGQFLELLDFMRTTSSSQTR